MTTPSYLTTVHAEACGKHDRLSLDVIYQKQGCVWATAIKIVLTVNGRNLAKMLLFSIFLMKSVFILVVYIENDSMHSMHFQNAHLMCFYGTKDTWPFVRKDLTFNVTNLRNIFTVTEKPGYLRYCNLLMNKCGLRAMLIDVSQMKGLIFNYQCWGPCLSRDGSAVPLSW